MEQRTFTVPTIRVQRLDANAKLPHLNDQDAAGLDLCTLNSVTIPPGKRALLNTGIAMAIPEGMVGLIWPRSKLAAKQGIDVLAGVVDCNYRGEVMISLLNTSEDAVELRAGDKVAQMVVQQYFSWLPMDIVDQLETTERANKGVNCAEMRMN